MNSRWWRLPRTSTSRPTLRWTRRSPPCRRRSPPCRIPRWCARKRKWVRDVFRSMYKEKTFLEKVKSFREETHCEIYFIRRLTIQTPAHLLTCVAFNTVSENAFLITKSRYFDIIFGEINVQNKNCVTFSRYIIISELFLLSYILKSIHQLKTSTFGGRDDWLNGSSSSNGKPPCGRFQYLVE